MNVPVLALQNISVILQGNRVLDDVSLTVNKGSHLAVIGKSGSGKTMLLRAIAGRQGISGGIIAYNFNKPDNFEHPTTVSLHRIALVESRHHFKNFSNTTDFYYQQRYNASDSGDALTVEQYLKSELRYAEAHHYWDMEKVIDRFDLTHLYNKQLIKLSNGETKRLRIAAALIKNPALLLLDQPLTGLDVSSRLHFNVLLREIAASGITIIMATSPGEIPDVVSDVAVLEKGKLMIVPGAKEIKPGDLLLADDAALINTNEIEALLKSTHTQTYSAIIKISGVNVTYGSNTILKNVSWQVKQGERWALLGPNGAGKSTLLSLVYGDNPQAYANDIVLFDKKRGTGESIWDIKRKCGFVSPELFQYFPMDNNCLQVVESGYYDTLGLFRTSDTQRAALALRWMHVLNIDRYAGHLFKSIPVSAQRLCLLARALVKNPTLLILDEPCQGMDDQQVQHFKQLIDAICHISNLTLIYVTHYQHEIPGVVDRYIRLQKGEVAGMGYLSK